MGVNDPLLAWRDCLTTYSRDDKSLDDDLLWENDCPPAIHDLDSLYCNDRLWQVAELAVTTSSWEKSDAISPEAAAHHLCNNASAGYYPNVIGPSLDYPFSLLTSVKKNSTGVLDWALVQTNWFLGLESASWNLQTEFSAVWRLEILVKLRLVQYSMYHILRT